MSTEVTVALIAAAAALPTGISALGSFLRKRKQEEIDDAAEIIRATTESDATIARLLEDRLKTVEGYAAACEDREKELHERLHETRLRLFKLEGQIEGLMTLVIGGAAPDSLIDTIRQLQQRLKAADGE